MSRTIDLSLCSAISRGFFGQVRYLIEFGSNINEKDDRGRTPLMLCALIAHTPSGFGTAQTLLEKGALVGIRDKLGLNALHYAVIWEKLELIGLYLSAVDFDLNEGDKDGNTVLYHAVDNGNIGILKTLLNAFSRFNMNLNKANKRGVSPLAHARITMNIKGADLLVEAGAFDDTGNCNFVRLEFLATRPTTSKRRTPLKKEMDEARRFRRPTSAPVESRERRASVDTLLIKRNRPLIKSALPNDLRNDPEYMFNLRPVDCFIVDRVNASTTNEDLRPVNNDLSGWRHEFRVLYKQYEMQCSPSWRQAPKNFSKACSDVPTSSFGPPSECSDNFSDRYSMTKGIVRQRIAVGKAATALKEGSHHQQISSKRAQQQRLVRKGSNSGLSDSLNSSSESLNNPGTKKRTGHMSDLSGDVRRQLKQKTETEELPPIKELN